MKLQIVTKAAFREGDEIEINDIPYEIKDVNLATGLTVACKVPGLESAPGVPLEIEQHVAWDDILTTRVKLDTI